VRPVPTKLQPQPRLEATQEDTSCRQALSLQSLRQELLTEGCAQGTFDVLYRMNRWIANKYNSGTYSSKAVARPLRTMTRSAKAIHQRPKTQNRTTRFGSTRIPWQTLSVLPFFFHVLLTLLRMFLVSAHTFLRDHHYFRCKFSGYDTLRSHFFWIQLPWHMYGSHRV